jgi:hypothetical protein
MVGDLAANEAYAGCADRPPVPTLNGFGCLQIIRNQRRNSASHGRQSVADTRHH